MQTQLCSSLVPSPRIQSVMASRKVAALAQRMIAPGLSRAALNSVRTVTSRNAGDLLKQLATETPHVEVIRYQHKNVKWTLKHVDYFAEALAIGMLDNGLRAGDVVLSWLPNHFSEQVGTVQVWWLSIHYGLEISMSHCTCPIVIVVCSFYFHPITAHYSICVFKGRIYPLSAGPRISYPKSRNGQKGSVERVGNFQGQCSLYSRCRERC